jgi:cell fate (sporulation/competence/biofilm development) regulator YmcA (YheA/YmcA/DUF963 family)
MPDAPEMQRQHAMKRLETQIGSLANEFLSTPDYTESLQIATDLIAAIHTLLEVRSES